MAKPGAAPWTQVISGKFVLLPRGWAERPVAISPSTGDGTLTTVPCAIETKEAC